MNNLTNMPPEGSSEYDDLMRSNFGENYEFGFRIGFGKRLLAFIIDFVLISIISFIILSFTDVFGVLSNLLKDAINQLDTFDFTIIETEILKILPISLLIHFLYYSTEVLMGASPGKLALSIKIGNENRTEATTNILLIRYLYKNADKLFTLLFIISSIYLFDLFSTLTGLAIIIGFFFTLSYKRQAFHDTLSKTAVFHKENIKVE